jgi:hypothetical protein
MNFNNEPNTNPITKQKRGRKSKLFLQQQKEQLKIKQSQETSLSSCCENPITAVGENTNNEGDDDTVANTVVSAEPQVAKKRGRKPKGGKIIEQIVPLNLVKETKPNIILHLKCSLKDLQADTLNSSTLESYNFDSGDLSYEIISSSPTHNHKNTHKSCIIEGYDKNNMANRESSNCITITNTHDNQVSSSESDEDTLKNHEMKDIWKKLKQLEHNLHHNNIRDKKSACFWCTYEFDNPPVYIPKHLMKGMYHVYGCFCSPECATAYLMKENLDTSTKFERYHLINYIYGKIYGYQKNVKPSPNPYYMLDKFYGNLSIQDYRALFKNERLFLIVDKPLTRILPELHDDNDEFIINNKIIPSNTYQVKRKMGKKNNNANNIFPQNNA